MFAGVGFDLRTVDTNGSGAQKFEFLGQREYKEENRGNERAVVAAESANGVVIWVGVGSDEERRRWL